MSEIASSAGTAFDHLTHHGKLRRLHRLARAALDEYEVEVRSLVLLKSSWNTVYRVDTHGGERYVLRINRPGERTEGQIRSELWWLEAIRRDTDMVVPQAVLTRSGERMISASLEGVPEQRHCVLFTWVQGGPLRNRFSDRTVALLGATMAALHNHADTLTYPHWLAPQRVDTVWTFGRPDEIYSEDPHAELTPAARSYLRHRAAEIEGVLDRMYADRTGLRFLHADMNLSNTRYHRGRLHVIDFDDSLFCFPIQDAGIAIWILERQTGSAAIRIPFKRGYASVRHWPDAWDETIDLFIDARRLDMFSLSLKLDWEWDRAHRQQVVAWAEARLRALG